MAKTKGKPGPKPGTTKKYGPRREYHILLSEEIQETETMSLADAFDQVAKVNNGVVAYVTKIIQDQPEIKALLQGDYHG